MSSKFKVKSFQIHFGDESRAKMS